MPSFEEDLAAAVDALGVQATGVIWGIAQTNWESAQHRDAFLAELTKPRSKPNEGTAGPQPIV